MNFKPTLLLCASLLALPAFAMTKSEYNAGKDRISAHYKAAKESCKSLAHNDKDVCMEEAKAKEKVAKAELEHSYTGKPADWTKVLTTRAETAYEVAKEKCDSKAGNDKDVCIKEAKATKTAALADAKLGKKVGEASKDAVDDKRNAEYKVAAEKCDALSGAAKSDCMAAAKVQYGKS